MKKAVSQEQVLDLNKIDFERAGSGRKTGYKFKIEFLNGRIGNLISSSTLASNLAQVILEDESALQILEEHNFLILLNTKFQLTIKNIPK